LEDQVSWRLVELLNDPNKLAPIIRDSIEDLRLREAELTAKIKPIDERLAAIALQKSQVGG
jgi:hypothetical protein